MDLLNGLGQALSEIAKFDTLKKIAPIFGLIGVLIRVAESVIAWSNKRGAKAQRQEVTAELRETTSLLADVKGLAATDEESAAARQLRQTLEQKRVALTERLSALLEVPVVPAVPISLKLPWQPFWRRLFLTYWPTRSMARVAQVFTWTSVALALAALASAGSDGFDSDSLIGVLVLAFLSLLLREWALFEEFDVSRLPRRPLMKRVTLFYRPARGLGWIAHAVYWYLWAAVSVLPFSLDEADDSDAYVGIPAMLVLLWLVHRWARHFDARPIELAAGVRDSPAPAVRAAIGLCVAAAIVGVIALAVAQSDGSVADEAPVPAPASKQITNRSSESTERNAALPSSSRRGPGGAPVPISGRAVEAPRATPVADAPISREIDGAWTLEAKGTTFTLHLTDGRGHVDVARALPIQQDVAVGPPPSDVDGFLVSGTHPLVLGTDFSPSGYAPDEILVQRQKDGNLAVWTRDNVNVTTWEPFTLIKLDPARQTPPRPTLVAADLDGTWTFADFGRRRRAATMIVAGGKGRFLTFGDVRIHQGAIARSGRGGFHVAGIAPTLESSSVTAPAYEPDQFVFLPKADGGYDVMLRIVGADKKPDWTQMKVVKAARPTR